MYTAFTVQLYWLDKKKISRQTINTENVNKIMTK